MTDIQAAVDAACNHHTGCPTRPHARGMCKRHYNAWRKVQGPKLCGVEACASPVLARGWCQVHYNRWRRKGDTHDPVPARINGRPAEEHLLTRVVPAEDGTDCWLWMGTLSRRGYGTMGYKGATWSVHRVAHDLWIGPIPDGYHVDHVFDRGCLHHNCVNPEHLEAVTPEENSRRAHARRYGWSA